MLKTTISIPVHNALPYVQSTLERIEETVSKAVPIILVDDCSEEETEIWLKEYVKQEQERKVSLVRLSRQQLFTRAANAALREAYKLYSPDFMVLLNSDVTLKKGWLENLFKPMLENEKIGLVGYLDSPQTESGEYEGYSVIEPAGYVTGHSLLLRTAALLQTGIFCETDLTGISAPEFAPYKGLAHIGSDRFLCYSMNKWGWKTVYCNYPGVEHQAGRSWEGGSHNLMWLSSFNLQPLWKPNNSLTGEVECI